MVNFPASQDNGTSLPNPAVTDKTNNPSHSALHTAENAAIIAVEAKVGTGASTPTANTLMFGTGTGTSAWTSLTSAQLAANLTDESGTGSAVFANTPTLITPKMDTLTESTPSNGVTIAGLNIKSGVLNTNNSVVTANITNANVTTAKLASAAVTSTNLATAVNPETRDAARFSDNIVSGCLWTADAAGSTRNASCSVGIVFLAGKYLTVAAVTARSFTASKDTYCDLHDNGDGTAVWVYAESTNNAASQALTAGNLRGATVVTGATNIAASTSIGQGGFANTLPVISSQILKGFDSLGNLVYPKGAVGATKTQIPYKFSAYLAGAQNSVNGTALVNLDTKTFDTGNNFNTTTHLFTAPVAGYYWFDGSVAVTPNASIQAALAKNGSIVRYGTYAATRTFNQSAASGLLQLAANDTIGLDIVTDGAYAIQQVASTTYLEGFLVSTS